MRSGKVNLAEKFAAIHKAFSAGIVGELNGRRVTAVNFLGTFDWHH